MSYVLFPYERVRKDSRVILYGMGWLGRMFVEQILSNNYCKLLFAVDRDYKSKNSNLISVKPVSDIQAVEYDYVVIALRSLSLAESVETELRKYGVPKEKCIYKYTILGEDTETISKKITDMDKFLRQRVGRMLSGLESFTGNECWRESCPDWKHSWLYEKYTKLHNALTVYKIDEPHKFVRIGQNEDGGYLIVDNYPHQTGKVLYAFGVGGDVSFEYEMAEKGWEIYLYDHTVTRLPQWHPSFHYKKRGLIGCSENAKPEFATLVELLSENGHNQEQNMLLKMDIEGYEVDVFRYLSEQVQARFAQIVVELHGLDDSSHWDELIDALKRLGRTHKLVHLHENNWSTPFFLGNKRLSEAVELTFVRERDWHFSSYEGLLLNPLDARCDNMRPERISWQGDKYDI